MDTPMRTILIVDTHWLWYAAGRYGSECNIRKPRVDYLALKNKVVLDISQHFEKCELWWSRAFVAARNAKSVQSFLDLLHGFGYVVKLTNSASLDINEVLTDTSNWELAVLAVGSMELLPTFQKLKEKGKRIALIAFPESDSILMDEVDHRIILNEQVLYEGKNTKRRSDTHRR
jgi:hypothetical protein